MTWTVWVTQVSFVQSLVDLFYCFPLSWLVLYCCPVWWDMVKSRVKIPKGDKRGEAGLWLLRNFPFASKRSWRMRSSHQGKKEVACTVSKPLVSCLWGCGESVNPPKLNIQEVWGGGFVLETKGRPRPTARFSGFVYFCQITLTGIKTTIVIYIIRTYVFPHRLTCHWAYLSTSGC